MPFEEEINHQHKFEMRFPWNRILIHENDIEFAIINIILAMFILFSKETNRKVLCIYIVL